MEMCDTPNMILAATSSWKNTTSNHCHDENLCYVWMFCVWCVLCGVRVVCVVWWCQLCCWAGQIMVPGFHRGRDNGTIVTRMYPRAEFRVQGSECRPRVRSPQQTDKHFLTANERWKRGQSEQFLTVSLVDHCNQSIIEYQSTEGLKLLHLH